MPDPFGSLVSDQLLSVVVRVHELSEEKVEGHGFSAPLFGMTVGSSLDRIDPVHCNPDRLLIVIVNTRERPVVYIKNS